VASEVPYADVHIHLLPGLDDGPQDFDESLDLLRSCWRAGTRHFCATPHFSPPDETWALEEAKTHLDALHRRAVEEGMSPDLRLGAEIALFPEILEAGIRGELPTLGGSRYVLLEAPPAVLPPHFPEFLYRFRSTGLVPLLGHPERTEALVRNPDRMREIVAAGCLVQVTAGSLMGEWGRKVRRVTRTFLREGWIHAVASDGHGTPVRTCDLAVVERELAAVLKDPRRARHLVTEGPLRLMGGAGKKPPES
jgi:protein-tyrosine phosphatase